MKITSSSVLLGLLACTTTAANIGNVDDNSAAASSNTATGALVILADQSESITACPCTPNGACTTVSDTTPDEEEEGDEDDSLHRLCLWSSSSSSSSEADFFISIDELTLVRFNETDDKETFVPLVPSPDISVNCSPKNNQKQQQQPEEIANLCIVEHLPSLLAAELFFEVEDESVAVTLTGVGNVQYTTFSDEQTTTASLPTTTTNASSNLRGNDKNSTTTTAAANQPAPTTEEVVVKRVEFQLQRIIENNQNGETTTHDDGISITAVAVISGIAVLLQSAYFLVRYMHSRSKADLPA